MRFTPSLLGGIGLAWLFTRLFGPAQRRRRRAMKSDKTIGAGTGEAM